MIKEKEMTPDVAVRILNSDYYEITGDDERTWFEMRTNGDCELIMFAGESVWNSEEDDRDNIIDTVLSRAFDRAELIYRFTRARWGSQ